MLGTQDDLIDIHLVLGGTHCQGGSFLLPGLRHLDWSVVVAKGVVLLVVLGDVEHLVVDRLVTVVYHLAVAVASAVLLVEVRVLGLRGERGTVSMNQEGISLSFMSR